MIGRKLTILAALAVVASVCGAAEPKQLPLIEVVKTFPHERDHPYLAAAISKDGKLLATVNDRIFTIQNWSTGQVTLKKPVEESLSRILQFSPSGKYLLWYAIKNRQLALMLFDVATGNLARSWNIPGIGITEAVFSPDEKSLLIARHPRGYWTSDQQMNQGSALLLSIENQTEIIPTDSAGNPAFATGAVWLPDGKKFLLNGNSLHELSGRQVDTFKDFGGNWVTISPDGSRFAVGHSQGLNLIDIKSRKSLWYVEQEYAFGSLSREYSGGIFIDNDKILTWMGDLRLWDAATGMEISWARERPHPLESSYSITLKAVSIGGRFIAGIDGQALKIWQLPDPEAKVDLGPAAPLPPLVLAAGGFGNISADLARVKALLARGADPKQGAGWDSTEALVRAQPRTALHVANSPEIINALLKAGADPNATSISDASRRPLLEAVDRFAKGHSFAVIDALLGGGANLELTNSVSQTPLQVAAFYEKFELVHHLLEKGARYDIFTAVAINDHKQVEALLKENAQLVNTPSPILKQTPIFWARSTAMVDRLIEAGAKIDIQDANLKSVLTYLESRDAALATHLQSKSR